MEALRILGATICFFIYEFVIQIAILMAFSGIAHLSIGPKDSFMIILCSAACFTVSILAALGYSKLIHNCGKIAKIVVPAIISIIGIISMFKALFIHPEETIIEDIGQGFLYYFGSTISLIVAIVLYIALILHTFKENEI